MSGHARRGRGAGSSGPCSRHLREVPSDVSGTEPEVARMLRRAAAGSHPMAMLDLVSSMLAATDPRHDDPFDAPSSVTSLGVAGHDEGLKCEDGRERRRWRWEQAR